MPLSTASVAPWNESWLAKGPLVIKTFSSTCGHSLLPSSANTLVSRTSFVPESLAASLGLCRRALERDLQKGFGGGSVSEGEEGGW